MKIKKKEASHKRPPIIRLCPGELSATGKSMDTEDRLVVAQSCRKGEMDNDPTGFLFGGDGKVV